MAETERVDIHDLPKPLVNYEPHNSEEATALPSLEALELNHARTVLEHVRGNRSQAAEILGISRATLYRLIAKAEA
jgi:two-component system response regulator HydG